MPTGFTITPDTKIDPNSELAKYVTQEEIEAFGFGSSDIVCDKEKNATLVTFQEHSSHRNLLLLCVSLS